MATSFSELLAPTKSEKHGALTFDGETLTITGRRSHCRYAVSEFAADGGRGFRLSKLDGSERYSVLIGPGDERICDCRGALSTGRCKHIAAMEVLVANDQI